MNGFDWFGLAYGLACAHRENLGIAARHSPTSKDAATSGEVRGAVASPLLQDSCGTVEGHGAALYQGNRQTGAGNSSKATCLGTASCENATNDGSEYQASPAGMHSGVVIDSLTKLVIDAEIKAGIDRSEESSDSETQHELGAAMGQGWRL